MAVFVQEGDVVEGGFGGLWARFEVAREGVGGHFPEGDEALFVAFADHADEPLLEVDVGDLQGAGFGDAEAAAIEDFEDGAVAQAQPPAVGVDGVEDPLDFLDREDRGEIAAELGRFDAVAGVVGAFAFENQPVEEGAERAEEAGLGAFGEGGGLVGAGLGGGWLPCGPGDQVALDVLGADRSRRQVGGREKFRYVAGVGRHRVRRQPALYAKVVPEVLEDAVGHAISPRRGRRCSSRGRGARRRLSRRGGRGPGSC